jgi:hypothetical protein
MNPEIKILELPEGRNEWQTEQSLPQTVSFKLKSASPYPFF